MLVSWPISYLDAKSIEDPIDQGWLSQKLSQGYSIFFATND